MKFLVVKGWICFIYRISLIVKHCSGVPEALESQLYRDLFDNYTTDIRPILLSGGNFSKQIVVNAYFGIAQLESLNEKDQHLTTHGYIRFTWKDELLTWNTSDYGGASFIIVSANKIWLPEVTPINSVLGATEIASLRDDTRVRIYYDGSVTWVPSMKMKTTCAIDVTDFPYDKQECDISYANWMYTASLLNFTVTSEVQLANISYNLEWTLTSTHGFISELTDGHEIYPVLNMKIYLKRNPMFFELNVLLPALLLSFLLIPMFILPVESGEKVSLGITLMLAYTIFLMMMTDVTPRSGTTPSLTVVILVCTMFSGFAIFINVLIISIHHHSPNRPVPDYIRKYILGYLANILCYMKYLDENEVQPIFIDSNEKFDSETNENNSIKIRYSQHGDDVTSILRHVEYFKAQQVDNDLIDKSKEDWCKVARVLDRLFICIYSVFFVCYSSAILIIKIQNQ